MRFIYEKITLFPRFLAHALIRTYQLTLSSLAGRKCRHLPTCSEFTDEAITRHGLWAGGWMGLARVCRCQPWGTSGFDPVPALPPAHADWMRPWRYGRWHGPLTCDPCSPPNAHDA
jgi:putative membrane protein insertion efficiency factor